MNPYANEDVMWQRLKDMQREAENRRLFVQSTLPGLAQTVGLLARRAWWLAGLALGRATCSRVSFPSGGLRPSYPEANAWHVSKPTPTRLSLSSALSIWAISSKRAPTHPPRPALFSMSSRADFGSDRSSTFFMCSVIDGRRASKPAPLCDPV